MSTKLKEEVCLTSDDIISFLVDNDMEINYILDSEELYPTTTQYSLYEALYSISQKELNLENLRRLLENVEIVSIIGIFSNFIPNKITGKRIMALRKRAGVYYD